MADRRKPTLTVKQLHSLIASTSEVLGFDDVEVFHEFLERLHNLSDEQLKFVTNEVNSVVKSRQQAAS